MAPAAGVVEAVVTYLEMREPPSRPPLPAPRDDLAIVHARRPTLSFYRYLYDGVGGPWTWTERRLMAADELRAIVQHPQVEVQVLWVAGVPAGYFELDLRRPGEIELAYFGLLPEFVGRGLGRFLLEAAVRRAWASAPGRVWVHTCSLDQPRALPLYREAGFVAYDERREPVRLLP